MIRDILEQNKISVQQKSIKIFNSMHDFDDYDIVGYEYYVNGVHYKNQPNLEQACRQYVKENGFKLEWLPEIEKIWADKTSITPLMKVKEYWLKCLMLMARSCDDDCSLFAWLYANDIEVVE